MMYINIVQWWMCNMKLFYIDFQSDLIQACLISFYQDKTSLISWGDDTDKPYLLIFILRSGLLEVQTREWRQGSRRGGLNVGGTWSCHSSQVYAVHFHLQWYFYSQRHNLQKNLDVSSDRNCGFARKFMIWLHSLWKDLMVKKWRFCPLYSWICTNPWHWAAGRQV